MQITEIAKHERCPEWLFFLESRQQFVMGGRDWSARIPLSDPAAIEELVPYRVENPRIASKHAANLPVPQDIHEDFSQQRRAGFQFLTMEEYELAVDSKGLPIGNVLLSMIYGQNYGTWMRVGSSRQIVALRSGSMQLIVLESDGFRVASETKTRGRAALAFAAHPHEPLFAYGDNSGTIHLHEMGTDDFGPARKVDELKYKVSRLEFIDNGQGLLAGGMGYLNYYRLEKKKYARIASLSTAVRNFHWSTSRRVIVVNQGMHGVTLVSLSEASSLDVIHRIDPDFILPVNLLAVDSRMEFMAVAADHALSVGLYKIEGH